MSIDLPSRRIIAAAFATCCALGAALLPAAAQEPLPPLNPPVQFHSLDHGITFTPPAGWTELREGLPPSAVVAYIGPRTDGFAANVNMTVAPAPPGLPPSASVPTSAAEDIAKLMRGTYRDYKVVGTTRLRVADRDAFVIANTFTNPQPKIALRNRQILFLRDGKLYTFTFTAHARAFKTVVPHFEKMMKTVKLTGAAPAAPSPQ